MLAELVGYLKMWCNSILNLAFRKTASPFTFSRSVMGNLQRSVKCPQPPSPRVRTHLPFLPDYSSLLVKVNAMLLCCVLACGGWGRPTTLPCGCGNQTERPLFACVYMIPRQLASVTSPTKPVLTTFFFFNQIVSIAFIDLGRKFSFIYRVCFG